MELDEQAMQELSTEHIQTENNQLEFDHEVSLIDDNEQVRQCGPFQLSCTVPLLSLEKNSIKNILKMLAFFHPNLGLDVCPVVIWVNNQPSVSLYKSLQLDH